MAVLQGGMIGTLVRLLGEWRLLRLAVSAYLAGLLSAVFVDSMTGMIASMYLAMTGATLCMPLLNAVVTHRTPMEFRGRMMGTTAAASSWGRVVGPLMAGTNLGLFGYHGAYLGSACVVMLYLLWVFRENALQDAAAGSAHPRG